MYNRNPENNMKFIRPNRLLDCETDSNDRVAYVIYIPTNLQFPKIIMRLDLTTNSATVGY